MECFDAARIDLDPDHTQANTNAQRILDHCEYVFLDTPEPGDLIFFSRTYDTPGASHVGIVQDPQARIMLDDHSRPDGTGPGMTDYSLPYWQSHWLAFGRVKR